MFIGIILQTCNEQQQPSDAFSLIEEAFRCFIQNLFLVLFIYYNFTQYNIGFCDSFEALALPFIWQLNIVVYGRRFYWFAFDGDFSFTNNFFTLSIFLHNSSNISQSFTLFPPSSSIPIDILFLYFSAIVTQFRNHLSLFFYTFKRIYISAIFPLCSNFSHFIYKDWRKCMFTFQFNIILTRFAKNPFSSSHSQTFPKICVHFSQNVCILFQNINKMHQKFNQTVIFKI